MKRRYGTGLAVAVVVAMSTFAKAEPTPELMVQEAAGLLHHSCDSLVEVTGRDEDAIISVVKKMVAVSLINRQIDISSHAESDDKMADMRAAFIEEVRAGCAADRKALLAGIVDSAVKTVLMLE